MKILLPLLLATTCLACTTTASTPAVPPPPKTMKAFASEQEMKQYFRELAAKHKRFARRYGAGGGFNSGSGEAMEAQAPVANSVALPKAVADESVTNTQHAGVD